MKASWPPLPPLCGTRFLQRKAYKLTMHGGVLMIDMSYSLLLALFCCNAAQFLSDPSPIIALPCHSVNDRYEFCLNCLICQSYMDFSKCLYGLVKIDAFFWVVKCIWPWQKARNKLWQIHVTTLTKPCRRTNTFNNSEKYINFDKSMKKKTKAN